MNRGAALIGFAIVAVHAAGFVILARHAGGTDLAIEVHAPLAAPAPTLAGVAPPALADRITTRDGEARGLYRRRWGVHYRGGFEREVGATQLVGPFQDPAAPPCSGRVVVGQRMLDDGHAGPGTIAGEIATLIDSELHGESIFPVGNYERIKDLGLRWSQIEFHPDDRELVGTSAPRGYVRVAATIVFARVDVPIVVALIPERTGASLHFRIAVHVELAFDNGVFQWVSDKLGANKLASRLARRQIDDVLVTTFAPPPPFELPGGQRLQFVYCDGAVEITEGGFGALPFAVAIGRIPVPPHVPRAPEILPPQFGIGARTPPPANTKLALDLDTDALNALLYELWRTGWLDRQLADVGLDRRFNRDPIVTEYLSIRISPIRIALPPVITAAADGSLRLAADARIAIADGVHSTTGRLFGSLSFSLAHPTNRGLPISVDLGALELSCERDSTTLVPCYADLVTAFRDRGSDFHGALTEAFARLLADIFVDRRVGASGLPADLAIISAVPTITAHGTLHLDLDASLSPVLAPPR
ncbi:MAG: hypothetical protein JWO36_3399 [Myxococcales bacterium]|nr:hypothetical protein [Myxococcales bacterium]